MVPDTGGHVNPAFPLNDRYLALDAYKFNVPNTESSLPGSRGPDGPIAPLRPGRRARLLNWSRASAGRWLPPTRKRGSSGCIQSVS